MQGMHVVKRYVCTVSLAAIRHCLVLPSGGVSRILKVTRRSPIDHGRHGRLACICFEIQAKGNRVLLASILGRGCTSRPSGPGSRHASLIGPSQQVQGVLVSGLESKTWLTPTLHCVGERADTETFGVILQHPRVPANILGQLGEVLPLWTYSVQCLGAPSSRSRTTCSESGGGRCAFRLCSNCVR